jgi:hypothetical protein
LEIELEIAIAMVAMHGHDVIKFDKIAQTNGKTTINCNETLQTTKA